MRTVNDSSEGSERPTPAPEQTQAGAETQASEPVMIVRPILREAKNPRTPAGDGGGRGRQWLIGAVFALLAGAGIATFVVLPQYVAKHHPSPPPHSPAPAVEAPGANTAEPPPAPKEIDYMALAEQMDKAEQARGAYQALFETYNKQGAAQWAAQPFTQARVQGEAGRDHFAKREFTTAAQDFKDGLASLQQVVEIAKRRALDARQAEVRAQAEKAAEQSRLANERFAADMSQALKLVAQEKTVEARAAFNRAAQIRPGAPEIQTGLARIAEIEKRRQIDAHHKASDEFERGERWAEALAEYEAALKLDPTLAFALSGRDRVQPRLALANQLEQLIAKPDRLLSPGVRTQAHALLKHAREIAAPGPVLRQQTERLDVQLRAAEQPLMVPLESDGVTQVVINRVSALGTFDRREVRLLPGNYTVVGTRAGFRDVRREVTVSPGQNPSTIVVRCEEPI